MGIVLALTRVSRAFGDPGTRCALEGVTLAVQRGELVAVVGPPGSGKSVLLDIIAGLDRATSGLVFVSGRTSLLRAAPADVAAAAGPALTGDIVLGPAPLQRLRDRSRSHVLIKTKSAPRAAAVLRGLLRDLAPDLRRAEATAVVDVDPQSFG